MLTNILVGGINALQYTQYLTSIANRTAQKLYLCKNLFVNAHGLFQGPQKNALTDPTYTPLTFRDITLYGMALKSDLLQDSQQATSVVSTLTVLKSQKSIAEQQALLIFKFVTSSIDYFRNFYDGLGFTSTYALADQLCQDLSLRAASQRPERPANPLQLPSPANQNPTIITHPRRAPIPRAAEQALLLRQTTVNRPEQTARSTQASSESQLRQESSGATPLQAPRERRQITRRSSVRERIEQLNVTVSANNMPEITPALTGAPTCRSASADARKRYADGNPTFQDMFLIFQDITSTTLNEDHPFHSMEGLLMRLGNSFDIDLNATICQRLVCDGFRYLNENGCNELALWLKTRSPSPELVAQCFQAFIARNAADSPVSIFAIQELLFLYTRINPNATTDTIAITALQIIARREPNHHKMDILLNLYGIAS